MDKNKDTSSPAVKQRGMEVPELRRVELSAGVDCLIKGLRDFSRAPLYSSFFGIVYMLGGWLVIGLLFWLSMPYFAFPAAIGFAIIAPFIAAGTYEISRRLEAGEPLSWYAVLGTAWQQKGRDMGWMALVTGVTFFMWVDYSAIVYLLFFGLKELDPYAFLAALGTTKGLYFILLGLSVGLVLAGIVFSITLISFPLLLDREIDFATAMSTSVRAVSLNPLPMIIWALIISLSLLFSFVSFLILHPIILPALGHATWHMYRKVVAYAPQPEAKRL